MTTDDLFREFSKGFDLDGVHVDNFAPELDCTNTWTNLDQVIPADELLPFGYTETYVPENVKCRVKCKDGFEFKEGLPALHDFDA